ncbi:unnamed protein product [Agarophyton chilense]
MQSLEHQSTAISRPPKSHTPLLVHFQYKLVYRLTCATSLLSILGIICVSYVRVNKYATRKVAQVAQQALNRQIVVGRVARCNPLTGITLKNVHILPSKERPTAPVVSVSSVHIKLSGLANTVLRRKPLALDVHINRAHVELSQYVVPGPKGLPVAQWDPGNYDHLLRASEKRNDRDVPSATASRLLRFVQPGKLSIQNSFVRFVPADFLEYGHGSEVVEVADASAIASFPRIMASQNRTMPFSLDGDLTADVKGTPVEGGTITMQCVAKGKTFLTLKPEDVAVTLRVKGEDVRVARIASFLNLPFRADQGRCAADVSMDFLYKSSSLVPIMNGQALLDDVALRFHPDPKTPEFHKINGKLRFEGKSLFFEGPVGELGSLPMTVVGDIHLENGYNLTAHAHQVDVNNIMDTFEVEKFVPVQGHVKGEAQMTGILEEPIVRGCAESVGGHAAFDRLPLLNGKLTFEWDAIAGLLNFADIRASVVGGGSVAGEGALFFDMTKPSPYGISRDEHCPRTPKATYWNAGVDLSKTAPLAPLPEDPLEIDEYAPFRPYDSMMFKFKVSDVDGGSLLKWYGGKYGGMAAKSVGRVSGEGVLAGHAKDANCRVVWKSTSAPPEVLLVPEEPGPVSDTRTATAAALHEDSEEQDEKAEKNDGVAPMDDAGQKPTIPRSVLLGGGNFRGLVYMKLGDPPEARRVKIRTIVDGFDARRAAWADDGFQDILCHSPLLETAADTYFKGVMFQRAILPPGTTKMPRTPQMELLGVDGALAVRKLSLNQVVFPEIMSGSFSFSVSDFSVSLKERDTSNGGTPSEKKSEKPLRNQAELAISASLKGNAFLRFRLGSCEADADLSKNERGDLVAFVSSKNLEMHNFVESACEFPSSEVIRGSVDLNMSMNLKRRRGKGAIAVRNATVGKLSFSRVGGEVVWRDQNVFLRKGTLKFRRSEYKINAGYEMPLEKGSNLKWNVNVKVDGAHIQDIAQLVVCGNSVARDLQTSVNNEEQGRIVQPHGPVWMQRLSQWHDSDGDDTCVESWTAPTDVSLSEHVARYREMMEEFGGGPKQKGRRGSREAVPTLGDVSGEVSGMICVKYDSQLGESDASASSAGAAVLQSALDQLARTSFSFRLVGADWMLDEVALDEVQASGFFEEGVLDLESSVFQREGQFGAGLECRVTGAGSVKASAVVDNAPAELVTRYAQAAVDVEGRCSGRVEVEGNLSNPRALGRVVWTKASLNGERVRGAKTDVACVNGRCLLNVSARIGGGGRSGEEQSDAESDAERVKSLRWSDSVVTALQDLAKRSGSRREAEWATGGGADGKDDDEQEVGVRVSAPVRVYMRRYVERRTPSGWRGVAEAVVGGAYPIDDEWIAAEVQVKKHGLLVLNTVVPEVGWEGGECDIWLRVSGTVAKPVVEGRVGVRNGALWPRGVSERIEGVGGEVVFAENGVMSIKRVKGSGGGVDTTAGNAIDET